MRCWKAAQAGLLQELLLHLQHLHLHLHLLLQHQHRQLHLRLLHLPCRLLPLLLLLLHQLWRPQQLPCCQPLPSSLQLALLP